MGEPVRLEKKRKETLEASYAVSGRACYRNAKDPQITTMQKMAGLLVRVEQ
jgi:hypothetical protein